MAVTGLNRPDFRTVSDFRKRHVPALQQLFVQVLLLCQMAGLVKLGHVVVDVTKLRAVGFWRFVCEAVGGGVVEPSEASKH